MKKSRAYHWTVIALAVLTIIAGIVYVLVRSAACAIIFIVIVIAYLAAGIGAKTCPHCGSFCLPVLPWKKDLGFCRRCGKKIEYDK